ncbi:MAG: hypothetical protein IJA16_03580, partial [Clostridia bacterium]|nr:hypothetical protein [Clostridia bacterium]
GVTIENGAKVEDSIIFPGAIIKAGSVVYKSLIGTKACVGKNCRIGSNADDANKDWLNEKICSDDITLIAPDINIGDGVEIAHNSMVTENVEK